MNKFKKKAILIIFLLAVFLRFCQLDKYPVSLFSDEVDLGYQAYSFLKTGQDYFGKFLPIHFHSFADFRTPLYLYSAVPTIAIFGLNEWGVRLPAAIFGSLTVLTFYFLVRQLTEKNNLALISAAVLAITPWHLHYSRAGFEITAMLFFLTLGFYLFLKELEKKKGFFLSAIVLGLAFYTYAPVKLFLPLFLTLQIFIFRKEILKTASKKLFVSFTLFLLIVFPMAKSSFFGQGNFRFSYLSIFSDNQVAAEVDRLRLSDASFQKEIVPGTKAPFVSYLFHNKAVSWFLKFSGNYLDAFSPGFLFAEGDPNLRHSIPNFGLLLMIFAPFCLWGFVKAASIPRQNQFWLWFLLLSPVASSLTNDGANHASRLALMMVPLSYFIGLGFEKILEAIRLRRQKILFSGLVLVLLVLNLSFYLHNYYRHYPLDSEAEWHFGFKQAIEQVVKIEKDYSRVYFSSSFEPPLIFYLFWSQYPPEKFNAYQLQEIDEGGFKGKVLADRYFFGQLKSFRPSVEKSLLLVTRNELGHDLEAEAIPGLRILAKIPSFAGQPRFYLVENE